jgi:hypothetical protein
MTVTRELLDPRQRRQDILVPAGDDDLAGRTVQAGIGGAVLPRIVEQNEG